ncbi:GNAT family N-acetyltransferase [Psychrobacter lutiphocae]|uniref:GNAT family N-acetyltransferase n=1 Tax=Psychrobacter lutiphocae TaxID=540500 RepID=UPI000372F856|nr:GNAT family N-acetyltransferase [Psychrobacter lutiphocae]
MIYSYIITEDLGWQSLSQWQPPDTPFMSFAYWQALTDTGAIGEASGWVPLYIVIYRSQPQNQSQITPVAVMPVFIKEHHQGEYVFDHVWAEAYARYGVAYYPRLVTSVPYTPVSGQRLWLAQGVTLSTEILQTAMAAIDSVAAQVGASSWHGLFVGDEQYNIFHSVSQTFNVSQTSVDNQQFERQSLEYPLFEREGCQFLWQNQKLTEWDAAGKSIPFSNFDDFLMTLTAKKRKNIRAERKKIAKHNLTCQIKTGADINASDWAVFYHCYAMTYAVRGRHPYLTPAFFEQIAKSMSKCLMLAQALDETGEVVASSLFFYDDPNRPNATLYGRYWGALAEYDSLHFELCYYQGIEFAIATGLQYFDPGTQGEHKLIRGFIPQKTHSLHRIYDLRFQPAIAKFCEQDRTYMRQYRQQAHRALPFNVDNMPEFNG